jgi:two-component system sensor histidine kinase DevS
MAERVDGHHGFVRCVISKRRARGESPDPTAEIGGATYTAPTHMQDQTEAVRSLLDALPDAIVMVDEAGEILLVNAQTEALFGYDRGDLLGRSVEDLLPDRFREAHIAHRTRYRVEPRIRSMGAGLTLFGRRADGTEFPVEISLSPLPTEAGTRVVAAIRDITERLEFEAETRTVMEMLDATRDGVLILDAATLRFTYVNQGAIEQVGYSRDELIGMTMLQIAPEFDDQKLRELLAPLERGEATSTTFTTMHRHRDGSERPVEISLEARLAEDGRPHSYVKIVRDIGDRLAAERLLRQAEQHLLMLEDRARIARDLHDIVIQKLFAAGMSVQVVTARLTDPENARRLATVVDDLDQTIREIRSVIFSLHAGEGADSGLRSQVLRVASEQRHVLGFAPRVHFDGVVDAIGDAVAVELLPTLREALSNVARHADASAVEVFLDVGVDDGVRLRVVDDGRGIPADPANGNGLRNITERATRLGGHCHVSARSQGGTLVEWRVPYAG